MRSLSSLHDTKSDQIPTKSKLKRFILGGIQRKWPAEGRTFTSVAKQKYNCSIEFQMLNSLPFARLLADQSCAFVFLK